MGQRLVITVRSMGEDICKIYYHWSAYSVRALQETQEILNMLDNKKYNNKKDLQLDLIRYCESNGGGIDGGYDSAEWKHIQAMYPNEKFNKNVNRNYGLIALSESGMADIQYWSEGDICIDLDDDVVHNAVFTYYKNFEEYSADRQEWDEDFEGCKLEDIEDIGFDLGEIPFDSISGAIEAIINADSYTVRYGDEIYELIA